MKYKRLFYTSITFFEWRALLEPDMNALIDDTIYLNHLNTADQLNIYEYSEVFHK